MRGFRLKNAAPFLIALALIIVAVWEPVARIISFLGTIF